MTLLRTSKSEATTSLEDGKRNPPDEDRKPTQSELLTGYAGEAELFHTPNGEAYAIAKVDDHQETWPLKSKRFTHYLLRRFYGKQGKAPSAQALTDARATIEARAMFDGPEKKVVVRVAEHRRGAGGPSHPGPDRRQHHAVLADGHRRLGGPVVLGERTSRSSCGRPSSS
jgi:hypothetical protein